LRAPWLEVVLTWTERNLPWGGGRLPEDRSEDAVQREHQLRLGPAAHAQEPPLPSPGLHGSGQLLEDLHVGAAEVVDGLLPVTHSAEKSALEREAAWTLRAERPWRPVACLGEEEGELQLENVRVLELVEEERADARLLARPEPRFGRQEVPGADEQL